MKKLFLSSTIIIALIIGCSPKSTPSKSMPSTNNTAPTIIDNPSANNTTTTTTSSTTVTTTTTTGGPDGARTPAARTGAANSNDAIEGMAIYNQKCQKCHGLKITTDYTVDRWISVMQVMAMKANLSDMEKQKVLAYVKSNAKAG